MGARFETSYHWSRRVWGTAPPLSERWVLRGKVSGTDTATPASATLWQPGFFDHLLRTAESYEQKWHYVRENPVRTGLVIRVEDWPYQGEIVGLDRV